ncbi:TRAFs-binding domain-containing protein [Novosphingobium lindaniclasticum]
MILSVLAQIRQTARAGDILRAWRMFESAGLLASQAPDALSLKGRLLKDRGLRSLGDERRQLLDQAQAAYMQAAGERRATYPLINAATIALLNGKTQEASLVATRVLELLESGDHEPETRYWIGATAAEGHLLLGNTEASRTALELAIAAAPEAWEDHAVTLRQFRQILERIGAPGDLFDHLRPPPSLYFSGIIGLPGDENEIREKVGVLLDDIRPGAVFGALAAGSDIVIAEMAQARGARLNIVLPLSLPAFRHISVAQYGGDWAERFDRLIEAADLVETLDRTNCLSAPAILNGSRVAMGLALRRSRMLATRAIALHVGRDTDRIAQAEAEWRAQGLEIHDLTLDYSVPASGAGFGRAVDRTVLASTRPLPPCSDPSVGAPELTEEGYSILRFGDPVMAMDHAAAILHMAPESRLGFDCRPCAPESGVEEDAELAIVLARAAPAGSICAPWPQIAVIDLLAPDYRFEAAGDIVTPLGDFAIGLFRLLSSA